MYLTRCLLLLGLGWPLLSYGQDERVFRDILLHRPGQESKKDQASERPHFKTRSSRYHIDLTKDKKKESFHVSKIDGRDWLTLFDHQGEEVFRYKFDTHGPWSRLFRVQKRSLSEASEVLILHFFEGRNRYLELKGTARLYFLTIDDNKLSTIAMTKGPVFWYEHRDRQGDYVRRNYRLSMFDYDRDGVREISLKHKRMSRLYKYLGQGKFVRPNHYAIKKL